MVDITKLQIILALMASGFVVLAVLVLMVYCLVPLFKQMHRTGVLKERGELIAANAVIIKIKEVPTDIFDMRRIYLRYELENETVFSDILFASDHGECVGQTLPVLCSREDPLIAMTADDRETSGLGKMIGKFIGQLLLFALIMFIEILTPSED